MPIQRFRSSEDAREALWVQRDDPQLVPRIRNLWTFASRLAPGAAPRAQVPQFGGCAARP